MIIKSMRCKNFYGFTLMELMITIVIAGIVTAFTLPQYKIAVERNRSQKARIDAKIIFMGLKNIRSIDNAYPVFAPASDIPIATLNSTLGINLIDTGYVYDYTTNSINGANYVKDSATMTISPGWINSADNNYYEYSVYSYTCTLNAGAAQSGLTDCHNTEAGTESISCSAPNATHTGENYCH